MLGSPQGGGLPWPSCSGKTSINMATTRAQNSPYFCVSSTREQSNKRSGARLKTESETGGR